MAEIPLINFNSEKERLKLLQYYIDIFNEVPSGNPMIRAYTQMEKLFLEKYQKSEINPDVKQIEKFDKLKALALNNENIPERKLAFFNSCKLYSRMASVNLTLPE